MNDANRERLMRFIAEERRWWYDPVPAWEKVTIPALVYESEWDKDVPAQESAAIIERALQKAGNKDHTIRVFPKSQHGQWAIATEHPLNMLSHRVHYDLLFGWLLRHVKVSRR
jgi:pimeloyl-ACP methyl ester carboxylesterase